MVENPLQCRRPWVWFLGWEVPLEKGCLPTPVFLPGESPWTEEPGRLLSMGSQRVRHDWACKHNTSQERECRGNFYLWLSKARFIKWDVSFSNYKHPEPISAPDPKHVKLVSSLTFIITRSIFPVTHYICYNFQEVVILVWKHLSRYYNSTPSSNYFKLLSLYPHSYKHTIK